METLVQVGVNSSVMKAIQQRFGNLRHGLSYSAQGSLGNLTVKLKADP